MYQRTVVLFNTKLLNICHFFIKLSKKNIFLLRLYTVCNRNKTILVHCARDEHRKLSSYRLAMKWLSRCRLSGLSFESTYTVVRMRFAYVIATLWRNESTLRWLLFVLVACACVHVQVYSYCIRELTSL